jgi:hypothetical protein
MKVIGSDGVSVYFHPRGDLGPDMLNEYELERYVQLREKNK